MQHIIDTHTFLWFGDRSVRLPVSIRDLIIDPDNVTQISITSFWEIGTKSSTGKLPLNTGLLELEVIAARPSIEILPITVRGIIAVQQMPLYRKDPFDRIIATAALVIGSILLSADTIFDAYGVPRT